MQDPVSNHRSLRGTERTLSKTCLRGDSALFVKEERGYLKRTMVFSLVFK